MHCSKILLISSYLVMTLGSLNAAELDPDQRQSQRELFKQVSADLVVGDFKAAEPGMQQLADYPLHSYLQYQWLNQQLSSNKPDHEAILNYIKTQADNPLSDRLRRAWLPVLAKEKRWTMLLDNAASNAGDDEFCWHMQAQLGLNTLPKVAAAVREFWAKTLEIPSACTPVLQAVDRLAPASQEQLWQRLELAMENNRNTQAQTIAKQLKPSERSLFELWLKLQQTPSKLADTKGLKTDTPRHRHIIIQVLKRHARQDPLAAASRWDQLKPKYSFSSQQQDELAHYLAIRAVVKDLNEAYAWLKALPKSAHTERSYELTARLALQRQDWPAVRLAIEAMPASQSSEAIWQYWLARSYQQMGDMEFANQLLTMVATETNFHSFLAADRLQLPYRINQQTLVAAPEALAKLAALPAIARIEEYRALRMLTDAWREWFAIMQTASAEELRAAAVLANQAGWADFAITTSARAGERSDYQLRFPMPFNQPVFNEATAKQLEPAFIYGVIRRESAYRIDAESRVGALGLMQLMPETARLVARQLGTPYKRQDLFDSEVNIRFGSHYLRSALDKFAQHQVLALAAYNAGPNKVTRWLPQQAPIEADIWLETMPYRETRDYVQAVLAYTTIFDWQLSTDQHPQRLAARMPLIPSVNTLNSKPGN